MNREKREEGKLEWSGVKESAFKGKGVRVGVSVESSTTDLLGSHRPRRRRFADDRGNARPSLEIFFSTTASPPSQRFFIERPSQWTGSHFFPPFVVIWVVGN